MGLRNTACVVAEAAEVAKESENGSERKIEPGKLVNPKMIESAEADNDSVAHRARGDSVEGERPPGGTGDRPMDVGRAANKEDPPPEPAESKGSVFVVEESKEHPKSVRK